MLHVSEIEQSQFRETAAPNLRAHSDPNVLHVGSFLWCRPYITLVPEWCHVLDDGSGKAVGYVICAPDTPEFVDRYRKEFFQVVAEHGISASEKLNGESELAGEFKKLVFNPEHMLQGDYPALVKEYPAHLHIDILSSHQSQGWGEKMINILLSKLRTEHIPGIHLGMVANNDRAHKFYDRIGFVRFDGMNDKGEVGRKQDGVYRVKRVEQ